MTDAKRTLARLQPLKTCPMCGQRWMHASDLSADHHAVFAGVQRTSTGHSAFLFTHAVRRCGSTFAIPARRLGSAGPEILRRAAGRTITRPSARSCLRAAIGAPPPVDNLDPVPWPRRSA